MKTYTSEAVFLLTTLVNIARARPADSAEERELINTIVLEIFEVRDHLYSQLAVVLVALKVVKGRHK